MSAPRMSRISLLSGGRRVKSTSLPFARRKMISPSTIRPGWSTIRKMDWAVTLLPQPLSPTMPNVLPGYASNVAPSTALTVPSSWKKYVFRLRTERRGLVPFCIIHLTGACFLLHQQATLDLNTGRITILGLSRRERELHRLKVLNPGERAVSCRPVLGGHGRASSSQLPNSGLGGATSLKAPNTALVRRRRYCAHSSMWSIE